VDASAPLQRQQKTFQLVCDPIERQYHFADKNAARDYFTRLTGLFKNLNYSREDSPEHASYSKQIRELADSATRLV
jgi:V/A-type H+-transporting ATPase subunit A